MAWTYSGNPQTSPRDRLRFELGDTDAADPLISDEEADYCLQSESKFIGALAKAAEAIASRFARELTTKVGPLTLEHTQRAELWANRAADLRRKAGSANAPSINSGSKGNPYFSAGMHDNK